MKIIAISGLGADERVFKYLSLDHELVPVSWIKPKNKESIIHYSKRLIEKYNLRNEEDFCVLGVSFGGLIATEISKIIKPKFTILISSIETKDELSRVIKLAGKLKLIEMIPERFFNPPKAIAQFLFGANNKELLNSILDDTDVYFAKWATRELMNWQNQTKLLNLIKIGGSRDKLLAPKGKNTIIIEKGEHFMIVDRADEISKIINSKMKTPINPIARIMTTALLFSVLFASAQASLEVKPKYCADNDEFQYLNEFKVYRDDSLIQVVEPKFGTTPVMKDLEYGNYRVEYQTIFQKTENVEIELRDKKKHSIELCLDYMNYDAEVYQPIISQLNEGEHYTMLMKSQGCFHTSEEIITIRLEKGKYNLTYLKTKKVLNEDEIQDIKHFELELNYMTSRGCTTTDLYVLTYNQNEVVISDGSCAWRGFDKLKAALKLN